ncbi:TIGR01458 family HAD-type hydrolase [Metapseudomonas lalkuanensis]|uniref:Haloacid dehalogenase-like hydrolase domain-containing protein 2 n=1 Tax=Metapseudomonas lalkuanensis TaxID=2604832 RepID=A0A5J6QME5_9GAMM|nr:TIGR01458 family HAD-type hydrolase [Pseudomonas lalkuanensis]QEY61996.1 TIGR01458 family HAD-type hydrolase [Pseudomonas lalkuanensis]UCO99777.1 TIGR01458 family HAD-type hydrolase [Pseudomonas lalkuanensis]
MLQAVLLDISGVLHVDDQPLPGALQAMRLLQARGVPLRLITNTSRQGRTALHRQLTAMGFAVDPEQIFTAPRAVLRHVRAQGLRPYCLIHPGLEEEFADLLDLPDPNAVVLGDAELRFDYAHLDRAFQLLVDGAPLICMGDNRYFRSQGALHLDAGPFVRALEYAAGTSALVLGKPSSAFFASVLDDLGTSAAATLMIGDDVVADVLGAQQAGLTACLVRTGKYRAGDEARAPSAWVAADLAEAVKQYC